MSAIDRSEWLAQRKLGVGGSDAAALLNVGYGCRRALWYDKTDTPEDFPREETAAMALGVYLEPWFASEYKKKTQRFITQMDGAMIHPQHPELRVNIDRAVYASIDENAPMGVLEIKSVGRAMFYKIKREGLPEDYILQLQHGMLVTGATWGSYAIGSRDSGELLWWDVEANKAIQDEILVEGIRFWKLVEAACIEYAGGKYGELTFSPDRLEPDDRRCQSCQWRRTCQGDALVQLDASGEMPQAEELRPLLDEYLERKGLLQQAEDLVDESAEELKTTLGDRQAVMVGKRKVYFRPQAGRVLYDGKGLMEAYKRALEFLKGMRPSRADSIGSEANVVLPPPEQFIDKSKPSRPLRIF